MGDANKSMSDIVNSNQRPVLQIVNADDKEERQGSTIMAVSARMEANNSSQVSRAPVKGLKIGLKHYPAVDQGSTELKSQSKQHNLDITGLNHQSTASLDARKVKNPTLGY